MWILDAIHILVYVMSVSSIHVVLPFYWRGWQGLIAQGCHSSILIIDPKTSQTIQVLEKHKANVVKVSWAQKTFDRQFSF